MKTNNLQWKKKGILASKTKTINSKTKYSASQKRRIPYSGEKSACNQLLLVNFNFKRDPTPFGNFPEGDSRGICNQASAPREKIFVVVVYVFGDLHWGSLRYCGVKEFFVWYSVIVYYCAWVDRLLAWVDFWHAVVLSYFRPSLGYFFGFLVHYPIPNPILYLLRIHIILL